MTEGEDVQVGQCPACGQDGAGARFCGRCGKRLRDTVPVEPLPPSPAGPAEHVSLGVDPGLDGSDAAAVAADDGRGELRGPERPPRRRVVAAVTTLVAVVAAAFVVVSGRAPAEVVTTPSFHTGVTSTVAATDVTTERWRTPVGDDPRFAAPEPPPTLLGGDGETVLVSHGGGVDVFDRASGTRLGSYPSWLHSRRGGAADEGRPTVTTVDGGELVTIDRRTGAVSSSPLAEPLSGGVLGSTLLGDRDVVVVTTRELRRLRPDGGTVWSRQGERGWVQDLEVHGDVVLLATDTGLSAHDLGTGTPRWSVEGNGWWELTTDGVGDDRVIVHDGIRLTAHDLRTGADLWSTVAVPPAAEVLGARDGVVYTSLQHATTDVARYDLATGDRVPALELPLADQRRDGGWWRPGIRLEGSLLLATTADEIVAFGLDGQARWRVPGHSWVATPDGTLLVLEGSALSDVDPRTGADVSQSTLRLPPVQVGLGGITVSGGTASLPDGGIVDLADGRTLAEVGDHTGRPADPIPGGYLIWSGRTDRPLAIDPYGATRWRWRDPRTAGGVWYEGRVGDFLLVSSHVPPADVELSLVDVATGEAVDGALPPSLGRVYTSDGDWLLAAPPDHDGHVDRVVALRWDGRDFVEAWRGPVAGGWEVLWGGEALLERTVRGVERRSLVDGSPLPGVRLPVAVVGAAFGADTFVFTTADDRIVGVDPGTTEVRWETTVDGVLSDVPTIAGDVAYLGTLDGRVHLVRLGDGELLETVVVGDQPVSQIVVAYGVMLVATGDEVVAFGPSSPDDLRIPDLPPRELGEVDVPLP